MIEKLLVNHIPIDRVAMRVVKKAKPEDLWAPNIRKDNRVFSSEALATRKIPQEALRNKPERPNDDHRLRSEPGGRQAGCKVGGALRLWQLRAQTVHFQVARHRRR
jgi:hypothetical protein